MTAGEARQEGIEVESNVPDCAILRTTAIDTVKVADETKNRRGIFSFDFHVQASWVWNTFTVTFKGEDQ